MRIQNCIISWQGKREEEGRSRRLQQAFWCLHTPSLSPLWGVGNISPPPSHHCILLFPPHLSSWHQAAPDRSMQALFELLPTAAWKCGFASWLMILLGSLCCGLGQREALRCGSPCPAAPSSPPSSPPPSTPPSSSPSVHRWGCWKAQQQSWEGWTLLKFVSKSWFFWTRRQAVYYYHHCGFRFRNNPAMFDQWAVAYCNMYLHFLRDTYALYLQRVRPFYLQMNTRSQTDHVWSLL